MSEVSPKDPQDAQPKPVTATTTAVTGLLRTGQRAVQAMNKSLTNFSQNRASNTAQDEPRVQPLHGSSNRDGKAGENVFSQALRSARSSQQTPASTVRQQNQQVTADAHPARSSMITQQQQLGGDQQNRTQRLLSQQRQGQQQQLLEMLQRQQQLQEEEKHLISFQEIQQNQNEMSILGNGRLQEEATGNPHFFEQTSDSVEAILEEQEKAQDNLHKTRVQQYPGRVQDISTGVQQYPGKVNEATLGGTNAQVLAMFQIMTTQMTELTKANRLMSKRMEKLESDRRGYSSGGLFSNTPPGPLPASSASLEGAHSQQRIEPADYPYDNVFNEKQGFGDQHSPYSQSYRNMASPGALFRNSPAQKGQLSTEGSALIEALKGLRTSNGETKLFRIYQEFREDSMLRDRSDAVNWLVNLRLLKIREKWSEGTYRYLVERLWNKDGQASVTGWFAHVSRLNLVPFEVRFIEKFGNGLQQVLHNLTTSFQGENQTCEEFMDQVLFIANLLKEWQPNIVPNRDYMIAGMATRFESLKMKELLGQARLQQENLDLETVRRYCQIADKHDNLYGDTVKVLRVQRGRYQSSYGSRQRTSADQDISIRQVLNAQMLDQESEALLAQVEESNALDEIYRNGAYPTVNVIVRVREIQREQCLTENKGWVEAQHIEQPGACVNGDRAKHYACDSRHVCPFYSLQGRCNMRKGARCRHRHVVKKKEQCIAQKNGGICPEGAYCTHRHTNDEYNIYFWNAKLRKYKKMTWKDHMSTFSTHHIPN
jgi:hypothetical protein